MVRRIIVFVVVACVLFGTFIAYALNVRHEVSYKYEQAQKAFDEGNYTLAIETWSELGNYKDSVAQIEDAKRLYSETKEKEQKIEDAARYMEIGDYKNAAEIYKSLDEQEKAQDALYAYAEKLFNSDYTGHLADALTAYQELGDYKDSKLKAATISVSQYTEFQEVIFQEALRLFSEQEYRMAINELDKIQDYERAGTLRQDCEKALARLNLAESISVGINFSVAITDTGRVITTDENANWQTGINNWDDIISVSCMDIAIIGLKSDGTVVIATSASNINVDEWQDMDIISVSSGELYVVGLRSDGKVVSQGHDAGDGQRAVDDWDNITAIATGWRHTVGLRKAENGKTEILITGYQSKKQLSQIEQQKELWEDIVAIAAGGGSGNFHGDGHTVGLKCDGTVVAVGDNTFGQCDVGSWRDVVAIAAGDWFTAGLTKSGNILITRPSDKVCEEHNVYIGACASSEWTDIVSIAAGCGNIIGIDINGNVHAAGNNNNQQRSKALTWTDLMVYAKR